MNLSNLLAPRQTLRRATWPGCAGHRRVARRLVRHPGLPPPPARRLPGRSSWPSRTSTTTICNRRGQRRAGARRRADAGRARRLARQTALFKIARGHAQPAQAARGRRNDRSLYHTFSRPGRRAHEHHLLLTPRARQPRVRRRRRHAEGLPGRLALATPHAHGVGQHRAAGRHCWRQRAPPYLLPSVVKTIGGCGGHRGHHDADKTRACRARCPARSSSLDDRSAQAAIDAPRRRGRVHIVPLTHHGSDADRL